MNFWVFTILTVINVISVAVLFIFQRAISNIAKSQCATIGEENEAMVFTRLLKVFRLIYSATIIVLTIFSTYFFILL